LKKRYSDDEPSPTKAVASPGAGPSRLAASKPKSKLIALAKATHNEEQEKKIQRMQTQFPRVPRHTITQALSRHEDDTQAVLNELARANERAQQESTTPGRAATNLSQYAFQPGMPSASSSLSSLPSTSNSLPAPAPPKVVKVAKRPAKNEKSTIYRNREKSKKRDPDEDSESGMGSGGDDSDGGWSDGEGRKRKRRKPSSEEDIDAAGAALRAFNDDAQEMLLGTIACSEEQAAKIVQLRPYNSVDDVRSKLSKTRGVSFKLFEQYEEIMEGYVQIDACLNRCEGIADDIANTLAVWKGASTISNSITGTPRSDGLNDVKVDVDKVSELLRNETDMRKRKILASYLRTQPALLSEGTVLKDYQLLGVNWLNLLYSRKIGCILADEMGEL
jgi:SWI/SNF-related matrix-associated actin-dependent regulator 1 of chromatin subfamily A